MAFDALGHPRVAATPSSRLASTWRAVARKASPAGVRLTLRLVRSNTG
jgi:hypothetical protein